MAVREETALKGQKKRRGKPTADVKDEKEVESEKTMRRKRSKQLQNVGNSGRTRRKWENH